MIFMNFAHLKGWNLPNKQSSEDLKLQKIAVLDFLDFLNLISRKNWVTEKYWILQFVGNNMQTLENYSNIQWWVEEHHFIEHLTNSNIIFWTSNEHQHVRQLLMKLKHPIFGFERTDIEHNKTFNRFTKLLIEHRPLFLQTSNGFDFVFHLVIELKHPIFGFEQSNIELRTLFDP